MRTQKHTKKGMRVGMWVRLWVAGAAFAALGTVGCLQSPDETVSATGPVTEAEIQAALTADSTRPVRPPRHIVCDTLRARLAALDSTTPGLAGLQIAVARVCALRPDSLRPVRPDSGIVRPPRPDSLRPKPDSLRIQPIRPDSLRPKPDSLRIQPVRPAPSDSVRPKHPRPDSLKIHPVRPIQPAPQIPDSALSE